MESFFPDFNRAHGHNVIIFGGVFSGFGGSVKTVKGVPFEIFLAPGLIVFAIIQNSFANTSSSMLILKIQGSVVDLLMPPLTPGSLSWVL